MSRTLTFETTAAVEAARERSAFIDCPVCGSSVNGYLFHKRGVRFVRCLACGLVYVNPTGGEGANYFDMNAFEAHRDPRDRGHYLNTVRSAVAKMCDEYTRRVGRAPRRVLLVGRYLPEFRTDGDLVGRGVVVVEVDQSQFDALRRTGDARSLIEHITPEVDLVVLNEYIEATSHMRSVVSGIQQASHPEAWVGVVYANAASLPARILRRYWPRYFDMKSAFLSAPNIAELFVGAGYEMVRQRAVPSELSAGYALERMSSAPKGVTQSLRALELKVPTGTHQALFRRRSVRAPEKLTIVLPVYNEARYVADVIEAVLAKQVKIPKEVIVVESNSTDGTRDIVKRFEGRDGIKVIYEDAPRGKGRAVRTGLAAASGTIILIQDADFEYDLDDYDALLEPILQHKTSFVLGSRSLGLDDWKVRKYAATPIRGFLMNFAQVGFAKTFNLLYQQQVTDVNTMFKVFRAECLDGVDLVSEGFNLDIELACRIVKNGYAPMEVPVNYVSRGFDEGKKIDFWRDAWPSYLAFFRFRFGGES
ncbi:MAG: glycosyltransferase [Polyangiaceae bacterium]|nr:glycosyltransferase [Polyangiaceae bacterium]